MKQLLPLLFILSAPANAIEISYGMGEATADNRLMACTLAENRALSDSLVNYASQFQFTNQSVCKDTQDNAYCEYIKEIDSSTAGTIRSVVDRIKRRDGNTCFVEVKVEIEKAIQLPASVDSKRIYFEGDSIEVDIDVGQPLYLYIFNFHDQGVDVLFPNRYNTETLIDDRFKFPDEDLRVIASSNGKQRSDETLLFLFTKQRQDIGLKTNKDSLKRLLESIPVNEKRLISQNIVIRSL